MSSNATMTEARPEIEVPEDACCTSTSTLTPEVDPSKASANQVRQQVKGVSELGCDRALTAKRCKVCSRR